MLEVTTFESPGDKDGVTHDGIDFVSLFTSETYGPPALVAPSKDGSPRAAVGQRVLYINTRLVPMFEIERVSD